jgi:hypothetical protein
MSGSLYSVVLCYLGGLGGLGGSDFCVLVFWWLKFFLPLMHGLSRPGDLNP